MIQTVGIKFEAQGLTAVMADMKALASSVKSLTTGIKSLETLNVSAAVANLNKLASGMTTAASQLVTAANQVNYAASSFAQANAGLGSVQPKTSTSPAKGQQPIGWWGGADHEMGRTAKLAKSLGTFYLLMKGIDVAGEFASTTFLGGNRERLLDPQLNLHSIGYKTQQEKRDVEYAAGDASFFYRGGIKKEEFMKSLAEMGSALPHDDPSAPAMNKQTHIDLAKTAISFGKMSQMTADSASQLMESLIAAQYYMGRPELKQSMKNQQGFTAQYGAEIAGQSYKAIDIFKMRGQDVAESMKYLAPSMVAKGWKLSDILTLTGYATTVGMKANMFARGMKSFLDANTSDIGKILLAGSEDESVANGYSGLKTGKEKKDAGRDKYAQYDKMMNNDLVGFLANVLSPAWERALSRGFDAKEFSGTNFLQAVRAILMKSSAEELLKSREQIESGKNIDIVKEHKDSISQDPAATAISALGASWDRLKDAAADSSGPLSRLGGGITDFTSATIDALARWQEWTNAFNKKHASLYGSTTDPHSGAYAEWAEKELDKVDNTKPMFTKLLNIKEQGLSNISGQHFSPLTQLHHFGQSNMGLSMFNVPDISPQPASTSVNVQGRGEVTVTIDDQGFFQRVNKAILNFQTNTGNSVSNTANSTGRAVGEAEGTATLGGMF